MKRNGIAIALVAMLAVVCCPFTLVAKENELEKGITAEQKAAKKELSDLTTTQKQKLLVLLNEGESDQLNAIDGVSRMRTAAIVKARPFDSIDEVVLVRGIGKATYASMLAHGKTLTQRRSSAASSKSSGSKK